MTLEEELEKGRLELGDKEYNERLRNVFGIKCLDFVGTIVINLPESCYSNCEYCIDKEIKSKTIDNDTFLKICERVIKEFPKANSVSITGGSLNYKYFNKLINLVKDNLPDSLITWNTNGVEINEYYSYGISNIDCINLHRNSINENINKEMFKTKKDIISLSDAKKLMGDKLFIRVTIDEDFDLDKYANLGISMYLNRMLPGNEKTDHIFENVLEKIEINSKDRKRRNVYLTSSYKNIPVRICVGDKIAKCVPGRRPTFLNVAIIHRNGVVAGSWFENDKVLLIPN